MEELTKTEKALMNRYLKTNLAITVLELCNQIMVTVVTITLFVAPIVLAIQTQSPRLILLWLMYPSMMFLRSMARYSKIPKLFFWIIIYLDFILIQKIADGPTWFFWPTLGLLAGYNILFYTIPDAKKFLLGLTKSPEWTSIEKKIKAGKPKKE